MTSPSFDDVTATYNNKEIDWKVLQVAMLNKAVAASLFQEHLCAAYIPQGYRSHVPIFVSKIGFCIEKAVINSRSNPTEKKFLNI